MKLSEAIRKGITKTRPAGHVYLYRYGDGQVYACALGAALVAVKPHLLRRKYMPTNDEALKIFRKTFPPALVDDRVASIYPEKVGNVAVAEQVTLLNDIERLPREEIADLLERNGY